MFQWVGGGGVSDGGASFLSGGGGCPMGEHQFWGEGGVSKKIIRWGGPCPTMGNPAQYQSPSFIHFAFQLFFSPAFLLKRKLFHSLNCFPYFCYYFLICFSLFYFFLKFVVNFSLYFIFFHILSCLYFQKFSIIFLHTLNISSSISSFWP